MSEKSRVIRVFLSSTFRDFAEERDLLVRKVFPELRRLCRERQVELVEVDLRWGITEEEAQQGKVLPICLGEIDRARPYFMGFIGDRYGWVPEGSQYPAGIVEREPWLKEHAGGKSVTELEMLHGVLNNPEMAGRAFFYFRDSNYSQAKGGDYRSEDAASAAKLEALKGCIRSSKFPVVEDYPNPQALADQVRADLLALIEEEYPADEVPDDLSLERMRHEAYSQARRGLYIGGETYFAQLDAAMIAEDSRPILISGEAGQGKSALIARWLQGWRAKHPKTPVILHHLNATAEANDPVQLVRRLGEEAALITGRTFEAAKSKNEILDQLPDILADLSVHAEGAGVSVLVVLDGLERCDSFKWTEKFFLNRMFFQVKEKFSATRARNNGEKYIKKKNYDDLEKMLERVSADMHLREKLKLHSYPNVHLCVCQVDEIQPALDWHDPTHLRTNLHEDLRINWNRIQLEPLSAAQGRDFIERYLKTYRKSLTPAQADRILAHPLSGRPLWLITLLEELRLFGVHEELEARLETLLSNPPGKADGEAPTIDDVYEHVLARIEEDIDEDYEVAAFKALWASYDGLARSELLELTGMPPAKWAEIQNALDENLFESGGQITFGNDFIRKAVEDRHLPTDADKVAVHRWLGEWFEGREVTLDVAQERVHQWRELADLSGDLSGLGATLLDVEVLMTLYVHQQKNLKSSLIIDCWYQLWCEGYWPEIEDITAAYTSLVDQSDSPHRVAAIFARLIGTLSYVCEEEGDCDYAGAEKLYRRALVGYEQVLGEEHLETLNIVASLGYFLKGQKDYQSAEPLFRRALVGREKVLGPEHPDTRSSVRALATNRPIPSLEGFFLGD